MVESNPAVGYDNLELKRNVPNILSPIENSMYNTLQEEKPTSRCFFLSGVPQGFNPPEKLGKFRQTIDLMLHIEL